MKSFKNFFFFTEMKNRVFFVFLSWIFNITLFYANRENILFYISEALFYHNKNDVNSYFIFSNFFEVFLAYQKTIFFYSNNCSLTVVLYQLVSFFSLSITVFELQKFNKFFFVFLFNWFLLWLVLDNFFLPASIKFLISFSQSYNLFSPYLLFFEPDFSNSFSFYVNIYSIFVFGLISLISVFFVLQNYFINTLEFKNLRQVFYCGFCFFSTVISPPDLLSQIVIFFLLIFFYELNFFLSMLIIKQ